MEKDLTELPIPQDVIFRRYDIRGIVDKSLTETSVYQIGRAVGSEVREKNSRTIVVGRDGRLSGLRLHAVLTRGILDSGCDVLDVGVVPTPVLYFAAENLGIGNGVMITGSHNPSEYNGLKIVLGGQSLSGEAIQAIKKRIERKIFRSGRAQIKKMDVSGTYTARLQQEFKKSPKRKLKVVVDCGNSVPGLLVPRVLRSMGHDIVELYCELDGRFPNHHPDPSQLQNLSDLIEKVRLHKADLGFAFDGDGDRLGLVDSKGQVIWPDRQMILFSRAVLAANPNSKVIFDVKCSTLLEQEIKKAGGIPIMCQNGHSLIKAKMKETGALLAGEMSGHLFFRDRWYGFDDAIYSAARLLEILDGYNLPPLEVFEALPSWVATPELNIQMEEHLHSAFISILREEACFPGAKINTIDGLRVDFADSWGLIRASNTMPAIIVRFEGATESALNWIQAQFRELLLKTHSDLSLPF